MALAVASCAALSAYADPGAHSAAVSPAADAKVSSTPTFVVDTGVIATSVRIELSRSKETKIAGDDYGAFIDPAAEKYFRPDSEAGTQPSFTWPRAIVSGPYFWHAQVTGPDGSESWSEIRTVVIQDDPITFEGWLLSAKRAKPTRECAAPIALHGKFVYTDNSESEQTDWTLRLSAAGKMVARLSGKDDLGNGEFREVACTANTKLSATLALRDTAGHLTTAPVKEITVAAPPEVPRVTAAVLSDRDGAQRLRMQVCAPIGDLTIRTLEQRTATGLTLARKFRNFKLRHTSKCQWHTVTWQSDNALRGKGSHAVRVIVADRHGLESTALSISI